MADYIDREKLKRDLIDNRSFYPAIVKSAIEIAPTEDVVPRSEYDAVVSAVDNSTKEFLKLHDAYQSQKRKLDEYKKFIGEIRVTGENHAVIIESEHTEYIDKRVAEGFKNMAVKQAKREAWKEIKGCLSQFLDHTGNIAYTLTKEEFAEFEKKYIG